MKVFIFENDYIDSNICKHLHNPHKILIATKEVSSEFRFSFCLYDVKLALSYNEVSYLHKPHEYSYNEYLSDINIHDEQSDFLTIESGLFI